MSLKCPRCETVNLVHSPAIGHSIYTCFKCMSQYKRLSDVSLKTTWTQVIKRIGPGDWTFGTNRQLTVNQIWSEAMEKLYEAYIAKEIVG